MAVYPQTALNPFPHILSQCPASPNYLPLANSKFSLTTAFNSSKLEAFVPSLTLGLDLENRQRAEHSNPKIGKKKKKLRPNFYEITREHWSKKAASQRTKFPWQESRSVGTYSQSTPPSVQTPLPIRFPNGEISSSSGVTQNVNPSLTNIVSLAPWDHGSKQRNIHTGSEAKCTNEANRVDGGDIDEKETTSIVGTMLEELKIVGEEQRSNADCSVGKFPVAHAFSGKEQPNERKGDIMSHTIQLPWERKGSLEGERRKSNTELAEVTIPESELRRLQNVALRMKERVKVGVTGITQTVLDEINDKWKTEEVVKIKFEGPTAVNMKRTHETLEKKTGGLVIWRSGSSVVIYRGMTYNLPCVQSYRKHSQNHSGDDVTRQQQLIRHKQDEDSSSDQMTLKGSFDAVKTTKASTTSHVTAFEDSSGESMDINDIEVLLEELGPRYQDWSGPHPLPVDADLLPRVVPGYKPPFRLLPYGMRPCLHNRQMTFLRRFARTMHPHFALGRSKQHEGLAVAIAKLWEKSAIAKIAIKRGVPNTCNERMAEEIKRLTGATLLSRNKEYIVFYRGNDFLPPDMKKALIEREQSTRLKQEEEEAARLRVSGLNLSKRKIAKRPFVAGTLAETVEAKSRWGSELSIEEREKMMRAEALSRHVSLVRYLERKLAHAQEKVMKAEKDLCKVQNFLTPRELPTDLETITDEERFLFRKIGLSMKPFLLLGRRGVYDGTIENMHLHWKYRELVKILVKGKSFPQVKHIAISLEAESGGILVSLDKTTKGYCIILYRGKNYLRPTSLKPKNLLTRRQALARSIELQRREALNHHISDLQQRIEMLKSELEQMEAAKETGDEKLYSRLDGAYSSDEDLEDEGEEAYLETYNDLMDNDKELEDFMDESV
ncbi:CRM-domain containing factor CFM3, chloroplastic/mitochondrial [Aristolochia californica]|uniref:CRM-domain containing factor CFM3, chloroplastic/mitochondrial n=1 Tax=Aristolochia californica TaxID=171875 RepID=UPI0035DF7DA8